MQGRDYWLAGVMSEQDPRRTSYETRARCYDLILTTLAQFDDRLAAATSEAAGELVPIKCAYLY